MSARDLSDEARRLVIVRDANRYGYIPRAGHASRDGIGSTGSFDVKVDLDVASECKLAPLGVIEHVVQAATYEWKCRICGESRYVPSEGGNIDPECGCDHTDGTNYDAYIILNGKRTFWTRVEDVCKPPTDGEAA